MASVVVAVSAALLVAVLGVSGSITGSIDRLATSIGGDADLEVSGITGDGIDDTMLATVSGVENVTAAVPLVRTRVIANAQPALLIGLGPNASELHSDLQTAIAYQLDSGSPVTSAPNGVIVGGGLGVAKGQQFDMTGSTPVTAVAVVDGPAARRLNDAHFVIAPLALANRISGREQRLDSILVFTDPRADVAEVRTAVTTALGGRAVVATPSFRAAQASSSFAILKAMTLLAASVSLVVASFLSYNAMSIAIAQRRPIITTIKSDMLAEAALVGFLGGVIGSAFGVVIGYFAIGELPSTMVQTLDARLEYVLPMGVVPLAVAACVVASLTASALAARQVHRVAPIEALAPGGAGTSEPATATATTTTTARTTRCQRRRRFIRCEVGLAPRGGSSRSSTVSTDRPLTSDRLPRISESRLPGLRVSCLTRRCERRTPRRCGPIRPPVAPARSGLRR